MILFLRNEKNQTLVDIEYYSKGDTDWLEISCSINIELYSKLLLSLKSEELRGLCIKTFTFFSEIRGWLNETYFPNVDANTAKDYNNVLAELRKIMDALGKPFELHRVED